MFKEIGIPVEIIDKINSTDDNKIYKDTVAETHIKKYSAQFPIIPIYRNYKKIGKAISSFGFKFLQSVHPISGRIHSSFWQIVKTGRMSSNSPNLQNIPATKEFRSCFKARPGYSLIIGDYSNIEARVLASIANETAQIEYFKSGGGDLHQRCNKNSVNSVKAVMLIPSQA